MPHRWPDDTDFALRELDVLDRDCAFCGRGMQIRDHRDRRFFTLDGPVQLVCKLNHCPDPRCPGHAKTKGPEIEATIALPSWVIGRDVFCGIGHRRFSRHWSIPRIRAELLDSFAIDLAEDSITDDIPRSQAMLAARPQDIEAMRRDDQGGEPILLSIDGLQPEKGHETLDVVRAPTQKRVGFAEALIWATAAEVRRLIARVKRWAELLGKPVVLWVSDEQDAFVTGIAAESPGVPHRYGAHHFLRDLAKPALEADSHAEVRMRKEVRGSRAIEQTVLKQRRDTAGGGVQAAPPEGHDAHIDGASATEADPAGEVVLASCCAARGLLNDDQGGPLHPPGLRMAEALGEVRESIRRDLDAEKGGSRRRNGAGRPRASTRAWTR